MELGGRGGDDLGEGLTKRQTGLNLCGGDQAGLCTPTGECEGVLVRGQVYHNHYFNKKQAESILRLKISP